MHNVELRIYAKKKRVQLWEVAQELGIADSSLSRKLRKELPDEEKTRIRQSIDSIASKEVD